MRITFRNGNMIVSAEKRIERPVGSRSYYTYPLCWSFHSPPLELLKELRRVLSTEIKRRQNGKE